MPRLDPWICWAVAIWITVLIIGQMPAEWGAVAGQWTRGALGLPPLEHVRGEGG